MSTENAVSVQIRADVGQYTSAMKDAGSTTSAAAAAMRSSMAGIGDATKEATGHMGGFLGNVRELRSEHRFGSFIGSEIAAIGLAGKGAAGEVGGLIAALSMGSGIGLAIGVVSMLAASFRESGKAAEELKKIGREVGDSMAESMKHVRESIENADLSRTQLAWNAEVEKTNKLIKGWQAEIDALIPKAGGLRDVLHELTTPNSGKSDLFTVEGIDEQIAAIQAKIDKAQTEIDRRRGDKKKTQAVEDTAVAQKEADDELNIAYEEMAAKERMLDEEVRNFQRSLTAQGKAEYDAAKSVEKLLQEQQDYRATLQKKREKDEDEANKKYIDGVRKAVDVVGAAFASAFKGLITGSKSVGDALIGMAQSFAEAAIDGLVKVAEEAVIGAFTKKAVEKVADMSATQGNIAVAVSGAAASMAGIPLVGPGLAMAAAAAMEADLEAMTAPLLSAAGGLDRVPSGGAFLMAHADETVLSAEFANPLRDLLASFRGGGGGGGQVAINIHAWDGADVKRVVEGPAFQQAIREAVRNGRWPTP